MRQDGIVLGENSSDTVEEMDYRIEGDMLYLDGFALKFKVTEETLTIQDGGDILKMTRLI